MDQPGRNWFEIVVAMLGLLACYTIRIDLQISGRGFQRLGGIWEDLRERRRDDHHEIGLYLYLVDLFDEA